MAEPTKDEIKQALETAEADRDAAQTAADDKQAALDEALARVAELEANQPTATLEALEYTPQPVQVILQQPNLAAEGAQNQLEGQRLRMDEAPASGAVFLVNGQTVGPDGQKVKG